MKYLDTIQVIALTQLDGVGAKTVRGICEVLKDQQNTTLDSASAMSEFLSFISNKKLVPRLKTFNKSEIDHAYTVATRIVEDSQRLGIFATSLWDSDYPASLKRTVDEKGKDSAPIVIYYKGNLNIATQPGLAVIGTREPTDEGIRVARKLSAEFAEQGINIVSGLALGCDTCGHLGALDVKGKTTAILAHGLSAIYPQQNETLASMILENDGLLLSEYPIGTPVTSYNLVARDRLQSGLANATLVIQTGISGGTMHAANATLAAQKPLYVVRYQDEFTLANAKTKGNDYLAQMGAKYLCETDNIAEIATKIKFAEPVKTSLFDF